MHGRIKTSKEKDEESKQKTIVIATKLKTGLNNILEKRSQGKICEEDLEFISNLLLINPDFHTLWNIRKNIILNLRKQNLEKNVQISNASENDKFNKICDEELQLIYLCLNKNSKSYYTWEQRVFIIHTMQSPNIEKELKICEEFLDKDERNFHCWDYRRFLCEFAKIDIKHEIDFTTKKIKQNFSNFSSFYYRSSLIKKAHEEKIINFDEIWDEEYKMAATACFVDPNDQSPWFYYRWLVGTQFTNDDKESDILEQILFDCDKKLLIFNFKISFSSEPFKKIKLITTNEEKQIDVIEWKTVEPFASKIWFFFCDSGPISSLQFDLKDVTFTFKLNNIETVKQFLLCKWNCSKDSQKNNIRTLKQSQIEDLRNLFSMEPENKWVNLAMVAINETPEDIFTKLESLDPLRKNYYHDKRSESDIHEFLKDIPENELNLDLSRKNLTRICDTVKMMHLRCLDLSTNFITRLSKVFNSLVCLEILNLEHNQISIVDRDFCMASLNILSLRFNDLNNENYLEIFTRFPNLNCVFLYGNQLKPSNPNIISNKMFIFDNVSMND